MQPSEVERMPYWEWEMSLEECQSIVEEEKKQHEEQEKGHRISDYQSQARRMMGGYGYGTPARMPRMPSMPTPKMPSIPGSPKI